MNSVDKKASAKQTKGLLEWCLHTPPNLQQGSNRNWINVQLQVSLTDIEINNKAILELYEVPVGENILFINVTFGDEMFPQTPWYLVRRSHNQ